MIGRVHLLPRFGAMPLDAITTERVQQLKSELAQRGGAQTMNIILTVLIVRRDSGETDFAPLANSNG